MVCIERKLEYKSPYFLGYVQPKVIMKALHDCYNTLIYKEAKVVNKKNCANLFESNKIIRKNEPTKFDNAINKDYMDYFQKVVENTPIDSLVQCFLEIEEIFYQAHGSFIYVAPN